MPHAVSNASGQRHVVHVIDEMPPDGAERLVVDILQNRSPEFRYSVVCIVKGGTLVDELHAAGVPVTVLGRRAGIDLGAIMALRRWFIEQRVDVVHTHLFSADVYGRIAARLADVPACFSTRHSTHRWAGMLRQGLARLSNRLSHKIIACGEEVGEFLVNVERADPKRVVVVANGVNLRRFEHVDRSALRRELGLAPDMPLLGVIGRLHPLKGHPDLLDALQLLRSRRRDFVCVLAGEGESRGSIESRIAELGLQGQVRLLGQRKDVITVMAGLDLFVMSSLAEGLPMALLEAMALGIAPVATAVGGVPSLIDDGVNGRLVAAGDPVALSAAIEQLLGDGSLRERLASNAKATVQARFSAAATVRAYERLYLDALAHRAAVATG